MKIIWKKMKDVFFIIGSAVAFGFFLWLFLTAIGVFRY